MVEQLFKDTKNAMVQTIDKLKKELARVRTGRASLAIFDDVKVDYYGSPTPINQVAGIANPEPNLITIQPWDTNLIGAIEKAILAANLGLTPSNDGTVIRISVPQLTEERRKEYVKQAHKLGEDCKTAIRNKRRDGNDTLKKMEKDKEISQDEMHRAFDEIQKITDDKVNQVDSFVSAKEKEILSF